MSIYTCPNCNHSYVPEQGDLKHGVLQGTAWSDLPADWVCPDCGEPKFAFVQTSYSGRDGAGFAAS